MPVSGFETTSGQPIAFEFARSSTPGDLPGENEGRLLNAILEKLGDRFVFRRSAGLSATGTASTGATPRGLFEYNSYLYAAYGSQVIRWAALGGSPTALTNGLAGIDMVTFARNNKQPVADIVIVRSSGGAAITDGSSVLNYPDADLPATVNSVAFYNSYFIFGDATTNKLWASGVNSTSINALSFATAEASPDALIRVMRSGNAVLAFGESTIEPWLDAGASPFPLRRHTSVIDVGLKEFGAVAGSQVGWDRGILFVAHDGTVRDLGGGYTAKRVSTPDVERFIADSTAGTFEANVYTDRGQSIWSLSTNLGTWEYHLDVGAWVERQSSGAKWRAAATYKAFGWWLALDRLSGNLLTLSDNTLTELGQPLVFQAESAPMKAFPLRVSIPAVHLNFTRGNGGAADFSFSLDGGRNWSDWESFSMGGAGEDDGPIIVNRLGQASTHGLTIRVRVLGSIPFSFMGAAVPAGAGMR